MGKLGFLLAAWLAHVTIIQIPSTCAARQPSPSNLAAEYDRIAEEFLESLTLAHTKAPARNKREISRDSLVDDTGVHRLQSITPVAKLCSPSLFVDFITIQNQTHAVCVSAMTEDNPATVTVGIYQDRLWTPYTSWYVRNPVGVSSFYHGGLLYVLVADLDREDGTDLKKINITIRETETDHIVHSKFTTDVAIWKMKVNGKYNMALSNSAGFKDANDLSSEIYVYEWKSTYFDKYSMVPAYDVKDIEPFHIHGSAYLAVANYRRGRNNYKVDSEIFKYDLDSHQWMSHQKIRTYGAMDWKFFALGKSVGQEFFLTIANQVERGTESESMIYKFVKDKFVPFQCLQTSGATSLAALVDDDRFLLAVANKYDSVHFYQYDGWRFVPSSIQYTQLTMSPGVNHLVFHNAVSYGRRVTILGVSNPVSYVNENSVYEIGFVHENFLQEWYDKSTGWCFDTLERIESEGTENAVEGLKDVLYVDQDEPITIQGNLYFDDGFKATKLSTPQFRDMTSTKSFDNSVLYKLSELQDRLQAVADKIRKYEDMLKNALRIDGDQSVTGNFEFHDVTFECQRSCSFDNINTAILNGEDVTQWDRNLVFLDRDQHINGTLFTENIRANDVIVHGLVDGVKTSSLVTKSGNNVIIAKKKFSNLIEAKDIEVKGFVDGISISPKTVLLTTGHQNITGNLKFSNVDAPWLDVGLVNNVDLTKFYEDVVFVDKSYEITGNKTFNDVVINNLSMSPGSTVNGINLVDLWQNTMWKDGYQEVTAPMTFSSVSISGNLNVAGDINGVTIPGSEILFTDRDEIVNAPQIFEQDTEIQSLVVNNINGVGLVNIPNEPPQLDVMLKNKNQMVTGRKTFHTIHLDADSYVTGMVDGVKLSVLKDIALKKGKDLDSNRTWIFNNLVVKGPLTVRGKVSGIDLKDIYDIALKLNDTEVPSMTFRDIIYVGDLESNDINGIDVRKDLVLVNEDQVVSGTKTFHDILLEDHSSVTGMMNNIDVTFLSDTLLKFGNQNITSSKTFNGDVHVNHLTVTGSINKVPFTEFVTLNDDDVIYGARTFENVTFDGGIVARNLDVTGRVSGIDIENMIRDTMTYDGTQNVTGSKIFNGKILLSENSNLITENLNGVNVKELFEDAVLVDTPQTIHGKKHFDTVVFDNLNFNSSLDGVTEWDLKHNWMMKDQVQTVNADSYFQNGLSVRNVDSKGFINGVNLTELDATIVKVTEPSIVEGPVIFEDTVISEGDITLSGKLQDVDLSEEAVLRSEDVITTGKKIFDLDLVVTGDMIVEGLVDGVSVTDLCEKTVLLNENQNLTRLTIQGDVTLLEGGTVEGKIDGVDLRSFYKSAVTALDSETFFSGRKTFQNLTIDGSLQVEGKFGGIDLKLLNDTYMSLTRDQDIPSDIHFEELDIKGTLSAQNFHTSDFKVNGIDLKSLDRRILKTFGAQVVNATYNFDEVIFADDVFVLGKVNGLEVPKALMRRNRTNYIQKPKIFEQTVNVLGDLEVGPGFTVQGVDVSVWNERAVKKTGVKQEVDGMKTFHDIILTNLTVDGLIDDMVISEDSLLMTYGDQQVTGKIEIRNNVEVDGSLFVEGLINGTDLEELNKKTVRRDRNNTITGLKHFRKGLTVHSLTAPSVAGVDVEKLQKKVNLQVQFDPLHARLWEIEDAVTSMRRAFENQAVLFQYYELFQTFEMAGAYSWHFISGPDSGELLLLSDISKVENSCTSVRMLYFDDQRKEFRVHQQELQATWAVATKSLYIWNQTFLFVANQYPKSHCSPGNSIIKSEATYGNVSSEVYSWNNGKFVLYQTLSMNAVTDMVAFVDNDVACLVYAELRDCNVYCAKNKVFEMKEKLRTQGGRKLSVSYSQGLTMLAIASVDIYQPSAQKSVDVYFWNRELLHFSSPIQVIHSTYAQSVLLVNHVDEYAESTFLIIAEAKIPRVHNVPRLLIYRYEKASSIPFHKHQEIRDFGELDSITLPTGELIIFALDSEAGKISLYKFKGASGFVKIDTVYSLGTLSLHAFVSNATAEFGTHYLALAGPRNLVPQYWEDYDFAKILKSKMKGKRLAYD